MSEDDYKMLLALQRRPLTLIELAHRVEQPNAIQQVWDRAAALCYLGLLNHYGRSGTYGDFGITDKGRLELKEYAEAFEEQES